MSVFLAFFVIILLVQFCFFISLWVSIGMGFQFLCQILCFLQFQILLFMSSCSRKEIIDKDRTAVFAKDIVTKNPLFTVQEIKGFFELFNLYADERRQANISDILATAKTLGFDKKHALVYEAIYQIASENDGAYVRFQKFLTDLTRKLGNPKSEEGRRAMFDLIDLEGKEKLTIGDLLRLSDNLGYGLSPEEIQTIVKNVGGPKERELTWAQFNNHIVKKIEKKTAF